MKNIILLLIIINSGCGNNNNFKKSNKINIEFKKEGELKLNNIKFDIEIADDDYQISTGLMYRDKIEDRQGMLFIFNNEDYRSFYMKNTRIYLDIIYIDSNKKIVQIYKKAKPYDETSLPSNSKVKYVLEIQGGLSDKLNIKEGDKIEFDLP